MSGFDFEGVFDADYLYFYEPRLTPERSEREVELITRLLELEAGMEVLDAACGQGRIANRLAARGCQVVGVDANPLFLDSARKDAAERGVAVEYVLGDIRELPWTERFDRVISWFTSFGYFDDQTNRRVLEEFRRVLRPRGRLLIDLPSRDSVVQRVQAGQGTNVVVNERGDDLMIDEIRFDALTGYTETQRIVVRDGRLRRTRFAVRLFTFPELRDWLLRAGFSRVDPYDEQGESSTLGGSRMIAVAHR